MLGFGIAGEAGLWAPTPRLSSPEQLAGQVPCTSADIYALGAILSDVLGRRCARLDAPAATSGASARLAPAQAVAVLRVPAVGKWASWPQVLFALFNALLRPARTLLCSGSGDLDLILSRALAPDPARRYPSADAFARHLQRYMQKRAFDAAQLAPSPPRRPLRIAATVLVGVLVLGSASAPAVLFGGRDAMNMGVALVGMKPVNAAVL